MDRVFNRKYKLVIGRPKRYPNTFTSPLDNKVYRIATLLDWPDRVSINGVDVATPIEAKREVLATRYPDQIEPAFSQE